jgi:hypothetical protein
VPPQWRVFLPPRVAASRPSGRLVALELEPLQAIAPVDPPARFAARTTGPLVAACMLAVAGPVAAVVAFAMPRVVAPAVPALITFAMWLALSPVVAFASLDPRLARRAFRCPLDHRRRKIALRLRDHAFAELLAQHACAHLLDGALGEVAQRERPE